MKKFRLYPAKPEVKHRFAGAKKVSNRQVQLIRAAACNGISHPEIAEKFGLSARYVHQITEYVTRKNVLPFTDKHVDEVLEMFACDQERDQDRAAEVVQKTYA